MKPLLGKFRLLNKIIAFVKDEETNLTTMTTTLKNILSCHILDLLAPFAQTCLGHVMSKTT